MSIDLPRIHHPHRAAATDYVRAPRAAILGLKAILPSGVVGQRYGKDTAFRPFYVEGASYGGLVGDVVDAVKLAAVHLGDGTVDHHRILEPATARSMRTIAAIGKRYDHAVGWYRQAAHRNTGPDYLEHLGGGFGIDALRCP